MAGIRDAYVTGYMRGHHDTVESCYGSPEDNADDYIKSAMCEADSNAVLGEVEALRAENKRLRGLLYELLFAMADANSVATMQSSAKLFKKWYEDEKKKGFNFA